MSDTEFWHCDNEECEQGGFWWDDDDEPEECPFCGSDEIQV